MQAKEMALYRQEMTCNQVTSRFLFGQIHFPESRGRNFDWTDEIIIVPTHLIKVTRVIFFGLDQLIESQDEIIFALGYLIEETMR